jgi:hypothetical protein
VKNGRKPLARTSRIDSAYEKNRDSRGDRV